MFRKAVLLLFSITPAVLEAAAPPGDPQIYSLSGTNKNQVVMLSNWPGGKVFSDYEDYGKLTGDFFSRGQAVWVWCDGKSSRNRIEHIQSTEGEMATTSITLESNPACQVKPLLLSNHAIPTQRWSASQASQNEVEAIKSRLSSKAGLEVTKITTGKKDILFLVFDQSIPAVYDTGGCRLLDHKLNQISMIDSAPLTPLIDLNGDDVPEFFCPSSDGMDAWLYQLFPTVNRELRLRKGAQ